MITVSLVVDFVLFWNVLWLLSLLLLELSIFAFVCYDSPISTHCNTITNVLFYNENLNFEIVTTPFL